MSPSLPAPRLAEAYDVLEVVRRGGLSNTFRAVHKGSGETRFVDVLRPAPGDPQELERRLDAEARPLLELRHANVAEIVDFAVGTEGEACIVRTVDPGEDDQRISLRRLTRDGQHRPSLSLATELLLQAATALAFLHDNGRHVGELSPEGFFLGRRPDGRPHLRLVDLGLAKSWQEEAALTAAGLFIGRLRYASPEQFDDRGTRGPAGDVYAWGLVAYELLTGTFPIAGESASSLIAGHLFRPPIPFDTSDPDGRIPEDLRALVSDALEKDPDARPPIDQVTRRLEALRQTLPPLDLSELDHWLGARRQPPPENAASDATEDTTPLEHAPTVTLPPTAVSQAAEQARQAPDLDALLAEARGQARAEDFVEARETVRRILRHEPEHDDARRLLASLEACLKIQLEESQGHETVNLPGKAPPSPPPATPQESEPATGEHETVRLHPGSETATVRLDAPATDEDATDTGKEADEIDEGHTRALPPDVLEEAREEPPPGTVTVPMQTVQEAKKRQDEESHPTPPAASEKTPAAEPEAPSFDDEGVGHPTSFGRAISSEETEPATETDTETDTEPSPPEPPPSSTPEPPPSSTPEPPSSTAEAGLSDLGFGDRHAGYQGARPRETRKPRSPSPLDARTRKGSRGPWWIVASLVAALLVFAIGYVVSSGVDPLVLLGVGSEEPLPVPPAETTTPTSTVAGEEPGFLRLDAEPWAEIVAVRSAAGEAATLRVEHTPAHIPLPPGTYSVVLEDPVSGERQTLEVEIASGETVRQRVSLRDLDVDDYFREVGWND